MRDVLPFVSLMKEIDFVLKLRGDTPTVLCSLFEKPVMPRTVYEDNQGVIVLEVYLQMQPCTKHIAIKYHHFRSFVVNGDVKIKHVDTKGQIADIFTKPLDSELFGCLRYKLNGWWVNGIFFFEVVWHYAHKVGILVILL